MYWVKNKSSTLINHSNALFLNYLLHYFTKCKRRHLSTQFHLYVITCNVCNIYIYISRLKDYIRNVDRPTRRWSDKIDLEWTGQFLHKIWGKEGGTRRNIHKYVSICVYDSFAHEGFRTKREREVIWKGNYNYCGWLLNCWSE